MEQTQIRLFKKQSDQGLPCLLFRQEFCVFLPYSQHFLRTEREKCSKFGNIYHTSQLICPMNYIMFIIASNQREDTIQVLNFHAFSSSADVSSKSTFSKNSLRNSLLVFNSLDPDQARHFVWSDLGSNCLQRLSADDAK